MAELAAQFSLRAPLRPGQHPFGLLLVSNDDVVKLGMGFETHPHRDMQIVTWVLEGSLVHVDSKANVGSDTRSAEPGYEQLDISSQLGPVDLEGTGPLGTGEAARLTAAGGQCATAGPNGAEIPVWEMAAHPTTPS